MSIRTRRWSVVVTIVGLTAFCAAAPFEKTVRFVQPDGTTVALWGQGDEFHAVFETLDGYTVVFAPQANAYFYAARSADGQDLVPSELRVGQGDPAALGLTKHLRMPAEAAERKSKARFDRWDVGTQNTERWRAKKAAIRAAERAAADGRGLLSPPAYTTTGTQIGLCLLIDFSDDPATLPRADIVDFCNGDDYTGYGNNGSVKQYFQDVSNGLLTYTNMVTAYIRMAQPKTYYNDTAQDNGDQGNLLIRDAIAILKALPNYATEIAPAFENLTVDGSGRAVACNVFYAGGNGGAWSYGLWPHSWALYQVGAQSLISGVSVWNYQITNIGSSLELGTFCHENGHMLCDYPDLYDYDHDPETNDYESKGGTGGFCLMGFGGHGVNPVQICAYLKRASGWATTIDLTDSSTLIANLSASGAGFNTFYRFAKPGTATEYYLAENRQQTGRDALLPAAGIALWHVDELGDRDNQSLVYNSTHANFELTLMQADNLWDFQNNVNVGDAQDLFYSGNPADVYSNVFNDVSAPRARWWDGSASQLNFGGFSSSGTTMTFIVQSQGLTILPPRTLPFTETFENNGAAPDGWTQDYVTGTHAWTFEAGSLLGVPTQPHTGSYNACFSFDDSGLQETLLVSPMLDFGDAPPNPQLVFWHCMANWLGDQDELYVYYKTTVGGEWNLLAEYVDNVPTWTPRAIALPETSRTFFIAFKGVTKYGYGVCIDDVNVLASPAEPIILTTTPLAPGTVGVPYSQTLSAISGQPPYTWTVVAGVLPAGLSLSSGGVLDGTPTSTASVAIDIAVTGDNDLAATNTFGLAILSPHALPFTEGFENSGEWPTGWSREFVAGSADWQFAAGAPEQIPSFAYEGDYHARFFYPDYGYVTRLVSPVFDLGTSAQNVSLTFRHCMAAWSGDWGDDQDELRVYGRSSEAADWTLLTEYTDDTPEWTERAVALPTTNRYYQLAFEGTANFGRSVCIDDVFIDAMTLPYAAWQAMWFTTAERLAGGVTGDTDDPDGDGIVNLLEYAWAMDPQTPDTYGRPGGGVTANYLTLSYRENKQATDLAYSPVSCTDLLLGDWDSGDITELSRADSNAWWQVTVRHDVPVTHAPARFLRLEVGFPAP